MKKNPLIAIGLVALLVIVGIAFSIFSSSRSLTSPSPTPTPAQAVIQLSPEDHPKLSLSFTSDGHYATVNISNIKASYLEYDLIYDAKVKNNRIQTGVNAGTDTKGKSTYTQKQLLGSESSGKFTYHTDIQNAVLNLTLRDDSRRSIFTASYPFEVTPGKSQDLSPTE